MKQIHPVTISDKAVQEVKKLLDEQGITGDYFLRIAVGGGGCSGGVEPVLGFDKKKEKDIVYEISGLEVLVDKRHVMHLMGKHVDFYEVEDLSGFHFVDMPK